MWKVGLKYPLFEWAPFWNVISKKKTIHISEKTNPHKKETSFFLLRGSENKKWTHWDHLKQYFVVICIPVLVFVIILFSFIKGTTIIGHDSEADFETPKGYEASGSHVKQIVYEADMAQIAALTQVSSHCQQHIKFRCYHVAFTYSSSSKFVMYKKYFLVCFVL